MRDISRHGSFHIEVCRCYFWISSRRIDIQISTCNHSDGIDKKRETERNPREDTGIRVKSSPLSIETTRRYRRESRASERRRMTASASRQVEDRRLLNETSGRGSSVAPARRNGLTFTWDPRRERARPKKIARALACDERQQQSHKPLASCVAPPVRF